MRNEHDTDNRQPRRQAQQDDSDNQRKPRREGQQDDPSRDRDATGDRANPEKEGRRKHAPGSSDESKSDHKRF